MTKKTFISVALFVAILFCSTFVFANTDNLRNAGSAITNVVKDAGNAVRRGTEDLGNDLQSGAKNIAGAMTDENKDNNNRDSLFTTDNNNNNDNGDYVATRTNTTGNLLGMNSMTWTWFILAIAAILIVALVWYYGSQNNKVTNYDND